MARFRDLPIRSKLMTGFMLTSLVALLIMMGALAFYDRETFRKEAQADVNVLAGVIGENASSSLVFNDPETARSTLAALRAQPHISAAFLFDRDGKLFASYMKPNAGTLPKRAPGEGMTLTEQFLDVTKPVAYNDARVGTVFLRSDLSELHQRRTRYLILAAVVLAGAWFVALLMSSMFQRAISKPIVSLLKIAKRVSREKNYALRAEKTSDDEVGKLIDGFNEMLGEIRTRDAEIQERHRQEMALARSIQTSVLPRSFELPGFDISAVMMPAEEVGGDFYEFRPVADSMGGGAWIGVGDVTGHGVTSGLIMMMVQSMFTMLCEQSNGHISPAKFVTLLNRALYYNLRSRLAQDRFMTLVVAKIDREGKMVFAGAHTDLLIYRAATHGVERIPTDGLWVGITDDIAHVTADSTVTLARGDIALFHTDGVTEARNPAGECFDLDRLTNQLRDLHGAPASDIVTRIAHSAWSWAGTPKDDVSLLAVKRSLQ
jgi:serine phosphatase RsbU (regulator of sigma subunit)